MTPARRKIKLKRKPEMIEQEDYERRSKELRRSGRVCVLMVMLALHEFGHTDMVGWIAAGIAGVACVAAIALWFEPRAMRAMGKWHKREGIVNKEFMSNPWYRGGRDG